MSSFENVKAVIFDFDGTLYCKKNFALKLVFSSLPNAFHMKKDRIIRGQLRGKYFGSGEAYFAEYISRLSKICGMSPEKTAKWYKEFYIPQITYVLEKHYKAYPESERIFKMLREKSIISVVYSDYCNVAQRMAAVGIDSSLADKLYSSEELGGLKPAKEPFLQIAKELGVEPENVLVVGDREDTDGQGARDSGMQFILVQRDQSLATCFSQFLPL